MTDEQELYKMIKRDVPSKIVEIKEETHDTKVYKLEVPNDFTFFAGQFIMLKVDIDESRGFKVLHNKPTVQSRAYSIASSPEQKGIIDLLIKKREDGFLSVYLNDFAKVGDKVVISGPYGKFYYKEGMGKDVVFLAAGCGVSALISMIRYIIDKKLDANATLIYSARTPDDILFKKELDDLKKSGVNVVITLTRTKEEHSWCGPTGRISPELIKENVKNLEGALYYICGMPKFSDGMTETLRELGVPAERIKTEKW